MAEMAVSFAIDKLLPLLKEEVNLLKGVPKEFADIKDDLENIQSFLKDADKKATAQAPNISEMEKKWVKQMREVAFRIEDIVDEYMLSLDQPDLPDNPGCAALIQTITQLFNTLKQRHQIASEIQEIKSLMCGIKEKSERYGFQRSLDQGSSNSRGSQNAKWHDPRVASRYIDEADVVGFEAPRNRLIDWMIKGRKERTVIFVVGMGGQGKTTLAKQVLDNEEVNGHFKCRVWITVSQSYDVEGLLRDMLLKLYKQQGSNPPDRISQMDRGSLTDEVRSYLQQKRYVLVFDDVWNVHFWDDIESAVIDNKNGSKILITTRNLDVAVSCKKSSFIEVLELQPLTQEQSLEMFNKKAFKFDFGCCPKELSGIANEIVNKCNGLPLAIIVIGGLLSTIEKNESEWNKFRENLSSKLKTDTHLIGIKKIVGLSYDDLPYYLKSCLLYFGMYPEDYEVKPNRVIRQWIAEGFVKEEKGETLEEVAQGYLTELMHRSLVQVSSIGIDGKAEGCCVHDQIREMILEKFQDLNFCTQSSEDGNSSLSGIIRRLSITTTSNDLTPCVESSHVRSLLVFTDIPSINIRDGIPKNYKLLTVLDCESSPMLHVPKNLGSFVHLKYLSFGYVWNWEIFLKYIGMLRSLETLNVSDAVLDLPKEISKLRKLRHLIGKKLSLIHLDNGIGEMTSLQTLHSVYIDKDGAAKIIKGLGKLKQMRNLGLINVGREDGIILSSSINEMQHLEKLDIESRWGKKGQEVIDLDLISLPTNLQKLTLDGKILQKLPEWIPKLQNLVELSFWNCGLTEDPLQSLKSLQNLLCLSLDDLAYEGCFHFEDGCFQKLKKLDVIDCHELREVVIDKGALPSLKKLLLESLYSLKNIPTGIQHLEKLEDLRISYMSDELVQNISTEDWNSMQHVPLVQISGDDGDFIPNPRS